MLRLPVVAVFWVLGLWLGYALDLGPMPLPALGALGLTGVIHALGERGAQMQACLPWGPALLVLLAGTACGIRPPSPITPPTPSGLYRVQAHVLRSETGPDGSHINSVEVLQATPISNPETHAHLPPGSRLLLRPYRLAAGTQVQALVRVRPRSQYHNPSPHPDWPTFTPLDGYGTLLGEPTTLATQADGPAGALLPAVRGWLGQARAHLRQRLHTTLTPTSATLACALLLGDRRGLTAERRAAVNSVGLAHVLAVSGLHIGLMAGLWVWLCRHLWLAAPRLASLWEADRVAALLGIPVALGLSQLCGGSPSALRAAFTAAIAWGVRTLGHRPSSHATLSATVLLLSAWSPHLVLQPGFLLSVLATAAILRVQSDDSPDPAMHPPPLAQALRIGWVTTVATAPLSLFCFGQLPLLSPITNLLGVPLISLWVLPLCLVHIVTACLCPSLAPCTATALQASTRAFDALVYSLHELMPSVVWPVPTGEQGLILALTALALLTLRRRLHVIIALGAAVVLWLWAEWQLRDREQPQDLLRVTFLDVGQGDSAWLDLPDGRMMLIDGGGDPLGLEDPGARVLLPLLRARRRDHVDLVVLSHPHPDHYGGLAALAGQVPVAELWDSGQATAEREITSTARAGHALLQRFGRAGTRVRSPADLCKGTRHFGAVAVKVLHPCPGHDSAHHENDNSLVLLVQYGHIRFLFTGDIERATEQHLVASGHLPRVDILKVGHHGSRTSTTRQFLDALRPTVAIISRGRSNRFGHPHPETLAKLRQTGTQIIDIAQDGGTIVQTDGREYTVRTWSGRSQRFAPP